MDPKKHLGLIGAGVVLLGTFLPFISVPFFGSVSLFGSSVGNALVVIVLAGAGGALAMVGGDQSNKGMIIGGISSAGIGLLLTLKWLSDAGSLAGFGLYAMIIGMGVAVAGGVMALKAVGDAGGNQ